MYLISEIVYFFAYRLFGYRLRVVRGNLAACFPEKSDRERREIERRYYHHLADLVVEFIYGLFATPPALRRRYRFVNRQMLDSYYEQGRTVVLMSAHMGNWEYMVCSLGMQVRHHGIGIGKPLESPLVGPFVARRRVRYGTQVVYSDTVREEVAYYARQYDYPVIYYSVDKTRRGRYTVTFSLLSEHPASEPQYSIVERYARRLEDDIRRRPELWLWSHRRWKLTRNGRIRKDGTIKIIEK